MGTLTCTHNLYFEQKYEKYYNFSSENYYFYTREKSLNIAWACFRNGCNTSIVILNACYDVSSCAVVAFCVSRLYIFRFK